MTDQKIYNTLLDQGIPGPLALLVVAQSKHETNDYTSNVYKSCNNCFGYKFVGQALAQGACTGAPEGGNYAKYASVEDSAKEIAAWIYRRQNDGIFPDDLDTITTADQYAALLKQAGYYGDSVANYTNGILRWFSSNLAAVSGVGIIILALGVFF